MGLVWWLGCWEGNPPQRVSRSNRKFIKITETRVLESHKQSSRDRDKRLDNPGMWDMLWQQMRKRIAKETSLFLCDGVPNMDGAPDH